MFHTIRTKPSWRRLLAQRASGRPALRQDVQRVATSVAPEWEFSESQQDHSLNSAPSAEWPRTQTQLSAHKGEALSLFSRTCFKHVCFSPSLSHRETLTPFTRHAMPGCFTGERYFDEMLHYTHSCFAALDQTTYLCCEASDFPSEVILRRASEHGRCTSGHRFSMAWRMSAQAKDERGERDCFFVHLGSFQNVRILACQQHCTRSSPWTKTHPLYDGPECGARRFHLTVLGQCSELIQTPKRRVQPPNHPRT